MFIHAHIVTCTITEAREAVFVVFVVFKTSDSGIRPGKTIPTFFLFTFA